MMLLFGCKSDSPTIEYIVGNWATKDGAVFQFNKDGTFETKNLRRDKIFQYVEKYKGLIFNETGTWELSKDQGQRVVFLYFNTSNNLPKGYATQILIAGSKGIFENKPPWYLFLWEGEEGDSRYKFIKK
jgi:hypothetical protein